MTLLAAGPSGAGVPPAVRFSSTPELAPWLHAHGISLAVSTYEAGKLLLVGSGDGRTLSVFDRTLPHCMGLASDGRGGLYVAVHGRLLRFTDVGPHEGWDRRYAPRMTWYTGDLDAHDVALDRDGPLIAATRFDSVVRPSADHSFEVAWRPPFLDAASPGGGDRCHLNGLAVRDGVLDVVTITSTSDRPQGWRDHRVDGGRVLSVPDGRVLASGLSMPHSPRWHDGHLWLHEAGRGRLVRLEGGRVVPVANLPGFGRGLDFMGRYAVVGLSRPRSSAALKGLPLNARLVRDRVRPHCGVAVLDLASGRTVAGLLIEGTLIHEIYDVAILRDTRRPCLIGFRGDERFTVYDVPPS